METGNLVHLGAELVVQMLMLYSTSPHARRLTSQMLTGDPFNIDVKLDMNSINRNVEILNVYLKTMGLKLEFIKKPKQYIGPVVIRPLSYFVPPQAQNQVIKPLSYFAPGIKIDIQKEVERLAKSELIHPITIYPLEYEYIADESKEETNK